MKITVSRADLLSALSLVASVVPAKSPRAILQNVLLDVGDPASKASNADGGGVALIASDLELSVRASVPAADIDCPGRSLLNAKRALQILKEIDEPKITLTAEPDGAATRLLAGDDSFLIESASGADAADFPLIDGLDPARGAHAYADISPGVLLDLIGKSAFAAEPEGTAGGRVGWTLQGVLVDWNADRLRFVATDGKRMAIAERSDLLIPPPADVRQVVPAKAITLLSRLAAEVADDVQIGVRVDERALYVACPFATMAALLPDGAQFPPYEKAMPDAAGTGAFTFAAEVARAPFAAALARASVFAAQIEKTRAVRVAIDPGNKVLNGAGSITFHSRDPGAGEGRVVFPCAWPHAPVAFAVNPAFVADAVRAAAHGAGVERIAFAYSAERTSVLVEDKAGGFVCVIGCVDDRGEA